MEALRGTTPPVFFVRVANKGLMLDATSTFADAGFKVVLFSVSCGAVFLDAVQRSEEQTNPAGRGKRRWL
jgi:hypothetical protein